MTLLTIQAVPGPVLPRCCSYRAGTACPVFQVRTRRLREPVLKGLAGRGGAGFELFLLSEAGSFSLPFHSSHSLSLSTFLPLSARVPPCHLSVLVGLLTLVVYFLSHKRPPSRSPSATHVSWDVYSLPLLGAWPITEPQGSTVVVATWWPGGGVASRPDGRWCRV